MKIRFLTLLVSIAAIHFSLSVLLFLVFGLGLEDHSFGSDLFWFFQQPVLGLTLRGFMPDFRLMAFPLNSIFWGGVVAGLVFFFRKT